MAQDRRAAQFPYELVIVSNAHAKELGLDVPLGGKVEPLN